MGRGNLVLTFFEKYSVCIIKNFFQPFHGYSELFEILIRPFFGIFRCTVRGEPSSTVQS